MNEIGELSEARRRLSQDNASLQQLCNEKEQNIIIMKMQCKQLSIGPDILEMKKEETSRIKELEKEVAN